MEEDADVWLIDYFKPYFNSITYYSWLREPDFCDDYVQRWYRDNQISVNASPERFELASFWRIAGDPDYVAFLKEVGVRKVQLTFFGMEQMTDKYTGRKGAFKELLDATEMLIANQIAPRWQVFINEENKDEIVQLLGLVDTLRLEERCRAFGEDFRFFIHSGSCDGENRKLYNLRIEKNHIPEVLIPYYMNYEKVLTERESCDLLMNDASTVVHHNEDSIVLNISNTYDVYF
ncbi:MAG: radical SAM protein, partial [Lachnospiraceae bacterium]|nr:radical SAM protein [Lachnospiraceae bacterium]